MCCERRAGPRSSGDDLPVTKRIAVSGVWARSKKCSSPQVPGGRFDNVDLVGVRENLEGLCIGHEMHAQALVRGIANG